MADNVFKIRDKETGEVFTIRKKVHHEVPETGIEKQNILGQVFNVPGAAIRSAMQGKGYVAGAINPSSAPRFQEVAAEKASSIAGKLPPRIAAPAGAVLSSIGQLGGLVADTVTQPADVGLMLAGKVPGTKEAAKIIGSQIMKIKPVAAIGRFLNKPRYLKSVKDALGGKVNAIDEIATNFTDAAKKMRSDFIKKWQPEVDDAIKDISKNVNATSVTDDVASVIDDIIDVNPNIGGKKQLIQMADDLRKGSKTAKQLANIKNRINIPDSIKAGKRAPNPTQSAKMKIIHDIDNKILELGGKKYSGIKARYREMSRAYSDTMSIFMEGNYPGGEKVMKPFFAPGFGLSPRKTRSLKQVSPYSQTDPMASFNAWRAKKILERTGSSVVAGGLLYGGRRKVGEAVSDIIPGEQG